MTYKKLEITTKDGVPFKMEVISHVTYRKGDKIILKGFTPNDLTMEITNVQKQDNGSLNLSLKLVEVKP